MNTSDVLNSRGEITDLKDTHELELSVIVPCYNEGDHIMSMSAGLSSQLDKIVGKARWQYVLVSNGCKDDTPVVLSQIAKRRPLSLTLFLKRPDYGNALRQGLSVAKGKWAFIINVDFWDLAFLSWAWRNRQLYDLIIGSKRGDPYMDKRPKYRRMLSWGLNVVLQLCFGLVVTDTHGQKLLDLAALGPILDACVMSRGQFDTEFTLRAQRQGLRIAEAPVPIVEERKQRNLMLKKIIQNFIDIVRLKKVIMRLPASAGIHYHRYSRFDMESETSPIHCSDKADLPNEGNRLDGCLGNNSHT
jgi:hypothetical protein